MKTLSESEKGQPEGSKNYCHGVIPFQDLGNGFNPWAYFEFYMSFLPDGGYLFPMPRINSYKFNIHYPEAPLFEINRKFGKNMLEEMHPKLRLILNTPTRTNYWLRAMAVM